MKEYNLEPEYESCLIISYQNLEENYNCLYRLKIRKFIISKSKKEL